MLHPLDKSRHCIPLVSTVCIVDRPSYYPFFLFLSALAIRESCKITIKLNIHTYTYMYYIYKYREIFVQGSVRVGGVQVLRVIGFQLKTNVGVPPICDQTSTPDVTFDLPLPLTCFTLECPPTRIALWDWRTTLGTCSSVHLGPQREGMMATGWICFCPSQHRPLTTSTSCLYIPLPRASVRQGLMYSPCRLFL